VKPSHRAGPPNWRAPAIVVVLTAALALAWPSPPRAAGGADPFSLGRSSIPGGPVLLTAITTGLIWRLGTVPPTTVTVRNSAARSADCEVWRILAGRGDPRPWENPVMRSAPVSVKLAPFASRALGVNVLAISSPELGIFGLSAWVHCRSSSAGSWVPSDGATMGGAIEVLDASRSLARSPASSSFFWTYAASMAGSSARGLPAEVRVEVANAWVEPVMVEVFCYLASPGVNHPWADPATSRCQPAHVNLAAVGLTTVDLTIPKLPKSGHYELSVWVHQQRAASSVPVDGVRLRPDVTVGV
jgi:hypothetical protein